MADSETNTDSEVLPETRAQAPGPLSGPPAGPDSGQAMSATGNARALLGQTIAERYELLEVLGQGGMGLVYRARDRSALDEDPRGEWVLKLSPPGAPDLIIERFLRSAATQARLCLPGVSVARDFGRSADGRAWLVMPFDKDRVTLQRFLEARPARTLSWTEAMPLFIAMSGTLARLHGRGVIHRDLKPSNILIRSDGQLDDVQLIDFGLVKDLGAAESLTATGECPGFTPEYAAPELRRSSGNARTDLYSLGLIMLEVLRGRPMGSKGPLDFPGDPVPRALDRLIRRLTDTDWERRPESAQELELALIAIREHRIWPWLASAAVLLALALAASVLLLTLSEERRELAQARAERRVLEAERDRLVEASKRLSPVLAPAASADEDLKQYLQYLEAEGALRAGERSAEVLSAAAERWGDLIQRSANLAVRDASRARRALIDAVTLRRGWRLEFESLERPYQGDLSNIYIELRVGEQVLRVEEPTLERSEALVKLAPGSNKEHSLTAEAAREISMDLKVFQSRSFAFDPVLFEAKGLVIPLPIEFESIGDGAPIQVVTTEGMKLTLRLRRS